MIFYFCSFLGPLLRSLKVFENVFIIRMCDFGGWGFYLVKFINFRAPYMIFLVFFSFWGSFLWCNFLVLKCLENVFEMRMCDYGGHT